MARIGADVESLQALNPVFQQQAQVVQTLQSTIDGRLQGVWWEGPAHQRFLEAWNQVKPALANLQSCLTQAGAEAANRAEALRAAGG